MKLYTTPDVRRLAYLMTERTFSDELIEDVDLAIKLNANPAQLDEYEMPILSREQAKNVCRCFYDGDDFDKVFDEQDKALGVPA
jgi:hypothetical protein